MPRMVHCVKLGREMEGLDKPPFKGEMGEKLFQNVSKEAWRTWIEHSKMLVNEYRLDLTSGQGQKILDGRMSEILLWRRLGASAGLRSARGLKGVRSSRGAPRSLAALCAIAVLLCSPVAWAETVALVTASPASERAARDLSTELDVPVVRRTSANARNLDALVAEARASWKEDLVVVLDTERAVVSVVRPSDGTMGSRALAPIAAKAPYVVALAARELLEIIRNAPPARAAALPAPSSSWSARGLALDVGLVESLSANGDIALLQPTLGADLEVSRSPRSMWFGVGLHARGLGTMHRDQLLLLPDGTEQRGAIGYQRTETALRLSLGSGRAPSSIVGWCDIGLAFIDLRAAGAGSTTISSDLRTAVWLGLGGELRFSLGAGLGIGLGAGGAWFPVATRFYASPAGSKVTLVALEEGNLEFRGQASLIWEFSL